MTNKYPNENGGSSEKTVTGDTSNENIYDILEGQPDTAQTSVNLNVARGNGSSQVANQANRCNWDRVGAWFFIAMAIIITLLAGYQLWTKLSFRYPE